MDRRELLDRTAQDAEERLLLSRVWDKREQCRQRNIPAATDFLSPQEQAADGGGQRRGEVCAGAFLCGEEHRAQGHGDAELLR